MPEQPSLPGLSDDGTRETLDLLAQLVASVSDRIDAQTATLERMGTSVSEARQPALAARAQTDPEAYGDLVGRAIGTRVADGLGAMDGTARAPHPTGCTVIGGDWRRTETFQACAFYGP